MRDEGFKVWEFGLRVIKALGIWDLGCRSIKGYSPGFCLEQVFSVGPGNYGWSFLSFGFRPQAQTLKQGSTSPRNPQSELQARSLKS